MLEGVLIHTVAVVAGFLTPNADLVVALGLRELNLFDFLFVGVEGHPGPTSLLG